MAKYQKYAEYQDSGIEWLGKIPRHWTITSLKRFSFVKGGYAFSSDIFTSVGKPIIRIGDIQADGSISLENCKNIPLSIAENSQDYLVTNGQILMAMTGATIGKAGIFDNDEVAYLNQRVGKFIIDSNALDYGYLWYLLKTHGYQEYIRLTAFGGAQPNISDTAMVDFNTCIPALSEQVAIANFLDYETAKIDTLIAKQEKLIELLKEKRQAVISHAVTKGLNPNVVMKDSGVEWLGQVPEHWQLVPLKYLCTFSGGGTPTKDNLSYWTDGNIPWVSPKDMKTFWISETQDYITEKAVKESSTNIVEQTSLLMVVRSGILQRTIPIAINTVPVTMNQDMKALKFGKRVLVEYIANLIHGNTAQLLLEWSKEGATVESIEHEYLANSLIPVPSLKEQEEITQVIAKKMKVYAELTEKAELQITLLQERRTALISSAVTGKINVSNWQHPNEAKTELSL